MTYNNKFSIFFKATLSWPILLLITDKQLVSDIIITPKYLNLLTSFTIFQHNFHQNIKMEYYHLMSDEPLRAQHVWWLTTLNQWKCTNVLMSLTKPSCLTTPCLTPRAIILSEAIIPFMLSNQPLNQHFSALLLSNQQLNQHFSALL